jgi:pyridoxine/pyridoxamine 5'-phosphate oxidase
MAKFLDDLSKWLEDASKVISKEAGDLTLKGKLKIEIFDLKMKVSEQFKELGKAFFDMYQSRKAFDIKNNPKVKAIVAKIRKLQRDTKEKEAMFKKVGGKNRS